MGTCCGCIERRTGVMALSVILILISISGASVFGALDQGAKTIVPRIFKDLVSIAVNVLLFVGALKDIKWMVLIWLIWTVIGMIITAVLFVIAIVLLGMMGHTGIAIFAAVCKYISSTIWSNFNV